MKMNPKERDYHTQAISELIALYFKTQPLVGGEVKATMECILKDMLDILMGEITDINVFHKFVVMSRSVTGSDGEFPEEYYYALDKLERAGLYDSITGELAPFCRKRR